MAVVEKRRIESAESNFNLQNLLSRLDDKEKQLLEKLAKDTKLTKEEICNYLFYHSATPYSLKKLKEENSPYYALLDKISTQISEYNQDIIIKGDYLPLIEKIRNPINIS